MNWRDKANQVIDAVMRANPNASGDELRKLLSSAYPFGERKHHPYKVWLSAVKQAIGERKLTAAERDRHDKLLADCEEHGSLFD